MCFIHIEILEGPLNLGCLCAKIFKNGAQNGIFPKIWSFQCLDPSNLSLVATFFLTDIYIDLTFILHY